MAKFNKPAKRQRIRYRIRRKIRGTAERPRLSIFRSNKSIYCQVIDDVAGVTLATASSQESDIAGKGNKVEQAKKVGLVLAERVKAINIEKAVFDRSGYLYHGRVKALADGAREGGLQF